MSMLFLPILFILEIFVICLRSFALGLGLCACECVRVCTLPHIALFVAHCARMLVYYVAGGTPRFAEMSKLLKFCSQISNHASYTWACIHPNAHEQIETSFRWELFWNVYITMCTILSCFESPIFRLINKESMDSVELSCACDPSVHLTTVHFMICTYEFELFHGYYLNIHWMERSNLQMRRSHNLSLSLVYYVRGNIDLLFIRKFIGHPSQSVNFDCVCFISENFSQTNMHLDNSIRKKTVEIRVTQVSGYCFCTAFVSVYPLFSVVLFACSAQANPSSVI